MGPVVVCHEPGAARDAHWQRDRGTDGDMGQMKLHPATPDGAHHHKGLPETPANNSVDKNNIHIQYTEESFQMNTHLQ